MTNQDLANFFKERPSLKPSGIAKEAGYSHTLVQQIVLGNRSLTKESESRIKKIIKKYGYDAGDYTPQKT